MDIDSAIGALRLALQTSPENLALRHHIGNLLVESGRFSEAEQEFRAILAIDAEYKDALRALIGVYKSTARHDVLIVMLENYDERFGLSAQDRLLYAQHIAKENPTEALSHYRRAQAEAPGIVDPDLEALASRNPAADASRENTHPARGHNPVSQTGPSDDQDLRSPGSNDRAYQRRIREDEDPGELSRDASEIADRYADLATPFERPTVNFRDVGGMDKVKADINLKIIAPLKNPELYKMYGKKAGGGILMYGPPGCGKTHIARCTAGEIGIPFFAVGLNDILNMWMGESEQRIHGLFERARRAAPCVLFFDEIDALAGNRSNRPGEGSRGLVTQFLTELDGLNSDNEGILVIGATNTPWLMDPAFRRPGRFDRVVFVSPPDAEARESILDIHLAGKPTERIDLKDLARRTPAFSGADLQALIGQAIEKKIEESLLSGIPKPLTHKDLADALKTISPTTRSWFATARNYALYANQDNQYDDILKYKE